MAANILSFLERLRKRIAEAEEAGVQVTATDLEIDVVSAWDAKEYPTAFALMKQLDGEESA